MSGWLQRWRRNRTLERRPIPDLLWQLTLARFPFLAARSAADLADLREMATLFLAAFSIGIATGSAAVGKLLKGRISARLTPRRSDVAATELPARNASSRISLVASNARS